jgi:L-threonine-O-3-phosphate decarboxylase
MRRFPRTERLHRGDLTVSFATDGAIPALSARLKREAADRFGEGYTEFCILARAFRQEAIRDLPEEKREPFLRTLVDSDVLDLLSRGDKQAAYERARDILDAFSPPPADETATVIRPWERPTTGKPGKVYLIGAGPGDPGLLTLKGAECLRSADTVLYDGMANPLLLKHHCSHAEQINVGKRKGQCHRTQEETISLLIEKAKEGRTVARLKGGDPIVFARGGEEARALRRADIPFEIIPGVSSISAVPAYAGIPITDRNVASSFGVYSAHRKQGLEFSDEDWRRIAQGPDTLIFLMGRTRCSTIFEKLLRFGRPPSTPVAIICNGTRPSQRRFGGILETICRELDSFDMSGPTLIVVGEVVNLRPEIDWFERSRALTDSKSTEEGSLRERVRRFDSNRLARVRPEEPGEDPSAFGHGGNLRQLATEAHRREEEIVDFSASINPLGPPEWSGSLVASKVGSISHYPDPDCTLLVERIGSRYGIKGEEVVVGNGSTEILYLLPQVLKRDRAVIPVPSYIDYKRAAERAGCAVRVLPMREQKGFRLGLGDLDSSLDGREVVFLGQPNNPTGQVFDADALRSMALRRPSTIFLVDEAFGDFVEELDSLIRRRPFNVVVVRSLTKSYAIPGLRLGYAIADKDLAQGLKSLIPPWSVNAIAQAVGEAALMDRAYLHETQRFVRKQRDALFRHLQSIPGLTPYPSQANFLLVRIDLPDTDALALARRALEDGIAIRVCDNFGGLDRRFLRVAVRPEEEVKGLCRSLRRALAVGEEQGEPFPLTDSTVSDPGRARTDELAARPKSGPLSLNR